LPGANNCEGDYGANDEKADHGHAPVKIAPPPGALISQFVEELLLVSESRTRRPEPALAVFDVQHPKLRVGREWKHCRNHPSWRENKAKNEENHLDVPFPQKTAVG
jgi:hypothetical protein